MKNKNDFTEFDAKSVATGWEMESDTLTFKGGKEIGDRTFAIHYNYAGIADHPEGENAPQYCLCTDEESEFWGTDDDNFKEFWGGLISCHLETGKLTLELTSEAAKGISTETALVVHFPVNEQEKVKSALQKILFKGAPINQVNLAA